VSTISTDVSTETTVVSMEAVIPVPRHPIPKH
jgi:hypothetical protein